jgi:hypothetical protein
VQLRVNRGPEIEDTNLFLALGKYVSRQQENLLTQAFVALFNHSVAFRRSFSSLVQQQVSLHTPHPDWLWARTQRTERLGDKKKLIVDAEILSRGHSRGTEKQIALIETKLTAPLGPRQATKYAKLLMKKRKRRKAKIVIFLTKYGVDSEIASRLPSQNTAWLTWSEVGGLLQHPQRRLSALDRLLWKEFAQMLRYREIPMLPAISPSALSKLRLMSRFVGNFASEDYYCGVVHADVIRTLKSAIDRLESHRDSEWATLAKSGWKPFARVWADWDINDEAFVHIDVGYVRWHQKGLVCERSLRLRLECTNKPRVVIIAEWGQRIDGNLNYDDNRMLDSKGPSITSD